MARPRKFSIEQTAALLEAFSKIPHGQKGAWKQARCEELKCDHSTLDRYLYGRTPESHQTGVPHSAYTANVVSEVA